MTDWRRRTFGPYQPKPAEPEPNRFSDTLTPRLYEQFWMIRRSTSARIFPPVRVQNKRTLWVQAISARQ